MDVTTPVAPSPLTPLQLLQQQLSEASAAYHQLMLGQSLVKIRHNEREMSYGLPDAGRLAAYIADLEARIVRVQAGGSAIPRRGRARPILF